MSDVITEIVKQLIGLSVIAVVCISVYCFFYLKNRIGILKFFGVSGKRPNIHVYLSRLEVKPDGTIPNVDIYDEGYYGPAICLQELRGALLIQRKLQDHKLAFLSKKLREWFGQIHVTLKQLDISIDASPVDPDSIKNDNFVLIGSHIYNHISDYYLNLTKKYPKHFYFANNDNGEFVIRVKNEGLVEDSEIKGRSARRELAIIERIKDSEDGNTVIICAGLGSGASYGSVLYLIDHWKEYNNDEEFGLCLAFPNMDPYDKEPPIPGEPVYGPVYYNRSKNTPSLPV